MFIQRWSIYFKGSWTEKVRKGCINGKRGQTELCFRGLSWHTIADVCVKHPRGHWMDSVWKWLIFMSTQSQDCDPADHLGRFWPTSSGSMMFISPEKKTFTEMLYVFLLISPPACHSDTFLLHTVNGVNFCHDCWLWSFLMKRLTLKLECLTWTPLVPVLHSRCYKALKLQYNVYTEYIQDSLCSVFVLCAYSWLIWLCITSFVGVFFLHFLSHCDPPSGLFFIISLVHHMVSSFSLLHFFPLNVSCLEVH